MKKLEKSIKLGDKKLTLATGHIAQQASGAVMATYGETVVLATVVAAPLREDPGYFPLTVDYRERLSAGGRIKGGRWVKRAGRPLDDEILTGRLIDRSIRPLFPSNYKMEVQVIAQVLSVDMETPPDIVAGIAVSAAIHISEIPWSGPVAMTRVGVNEGKLSINPTNEMVENSQMDLVASFIKDAVVMIEAGADQVDEKEILKGLSQGEKESKKVIGLIEDFAKEVGNKKQAVEKKKTNSTLEKKVKGLVEDKIPGIVEKRAKMEGGRSFEMEELEAALKDEFESDAKEAVEILNKLYKDYIRKMVLSGKRPDGRKPDEIRNLSSQVGVLPRVHGSAIFERGQTQALTVATLGAPSLEQFIETAEGEEKKRYIHHYAMPPYSVGDAGRFGFPSRREIGHGALAERALMPVIPSEEEFPYTIYVLTEILSSNGSTSMASTCGSTLSLMDAGVPIKAAVAGIAMGLIVESKEKFEVLTDITGMEDGNGDMDFKVAGTKDGVTALQLDVKTLMLSTSILKSAFDQAKSARLEILKSMAKEIKEPRKSVSAFAPKIKSFSIPQDKIGELIGPGGKSIRKLMAETNTQIDVDDDGLVSIAGEAEDEVAKALSWVESLAKEPKPGEIYEGVVKRIQPFGAFVEILPGKDGLVHVSDMSEEFVKDPNQVVKLEDKVQVRVKEIDEMGRLNLSMILDPSKEKKNNRRGPKRDKGGKRGFDRRRRGPDRSRQRSSGPHFPTSRLLDRDKKDFSR